MYSFTKILLIGAELFCAGRRDTVAMKEIAIVPRNCIANSPEKLLELGTRGYLKSVIVKTTLARDCSILFFIYRIFR
jgi:hypothetical protein